MALQPLTIWCNAHLADMAHRKLTAGVAPHRLIFSTQATTNLAAGESDPTLAQADIAFGQPDPRQVIDLKKLKWIHLTSAGYTRYDRGDIREALRLRGAMMTNSSSVFDEPCTQHVLAMMLAQSRQLPAAMHNQLHHRGWPAPSFRSRSRLLNGKTALILGFGAIARRLVELLAPFQMKITAVRRNVRGDETILVNPVSDIDSLLPDADHVINILPANEQTDQLLNADRIARMKPGAVFYNIGRGNTVDQYALRTALDCDRLSAAYLDVMTPEPLPPEDPLWTTPNCYITPHTAGGCDEEFDRMVNHFLDNLRKFTTGEGLTDRII